MSKNRYVSRVSYNATNSHGDMTCHCSVNVAHTVDTDEAVEAAVPEDVKAYRDYKFVSRRLIKVITPPKTFVIQKVSGVSGNCLLGEGPTPAAAWADAFGPKPWSPGQKKSAKGAWISEVTDDELADLKEARANA